MTSIIVDILIFCFSVYACNTMLEEWLRTDPSACWTNLKLLSIIESPEVCCTSGEMISALELSS